MSYTLPMLESNGTIVDLTGMPCVKFAGGKVRLKKHGSLAFTVTRPGFRSELTIPVRVSSPAGTALRDDLRAFLSAAGYNVRWIN